MTRAKWLVIAGAVALLAIAAGAVFLLRRDGLRKGVESVNAAPAETVAHEVNLTGKIQGQHVVPVGTAISGTIDEFLVDTGDEVFEGQLLARISSQGMEEAAQEATRLAQNAREKVSSIEGRIIAAKLEASRARVDANRSRDQFERADKAYQRQQMLFREGATPRLVYEKAGREFETARAEFTSLDELARQAEERLSGLTQELEAEQRTLNERGAAVEDAKNQAAASEVHSPVSGIVTARKGEAGKSIGHEEARDLFDIAVDLSQLEVLVTPEPPVLRRLRPGQPASISIAELPGTVAGTIKELKGSDAIVEFISPTPVIRPGMTANVRITLE
jgi:membrane fusion protein (multidrug efflux system)